MIDQCYKDIVTRGYLLKKIGRLVQGEIKTMCSDRVASVLQSKDYKNLKEFKWDSVLNEIKTHAPVLLNILLSCTRTRHPRSNQAATMCFVASILFKFRYSRMNAVQKILSLVLYAGHCGKKVCVVCTWT